MSGDKESFKVDYAGNEFTWRVMPGFASPPRYQPYSFNFIFNKEFNKKVE